MVQLPCTYIYVEEIWVPISRTNTLKIIFLRQWFYITIIMSDEVMVILGIRAGWSIKISVSTHFQTLFDKTSNIWHRIWRWNQSGKFKPFNELSLQNQVSLHLHYSNGNWYFSCITSMGWTFNFNELIERVIESENIIDFNDITDDTDTKKMFISVQHLNSIVDFISKTLGWRNEKILFMLPTNDEKCLRNS